MTEIVAELRTSISEINNFIIKHFYPNPVINEAIIKYQLSQKNKVEIRLFDISGQPIGLLLAEQAGAGIHTRKIDLSNLPKGVYFLNLIANNQNEVTF